MSVMAVILVALILSLYIFILNKDFFDSFKFYHLRAYFGVMAYSINNLKMGDLKNNAAAALFGAGGIPGNTAQAYEKNAITIPALLYHGVIGDPDGGNVVLKNFSEQMVSLKKEGWQTVGIEDFYGFIKGEKKLPYKSFLLTFDDGRKDSYYSVDPILKALGFRAVMFAITGHSLQGEGNKPSHFYLSENELKKMANSGRWDIQSHGRYDHGFHKTDNAGGMGHFLSNKLWLDDKNRLETEKEFKERIYEDLSLSKKELEDKLGVNVISFAFPFGDFGQSSVNFPQSEKIILESVRSLYPVAFYQFWPGKGFSFNYPDDDNFLIKRINVGPDWNGSQLLKILNNGGEKELSYRDDFSSDKGWVEDWGQAEIKNNAFSLASSASTSGAAVFLDGSRDWKDYLFESKIDWTAGRSVALLSRYRDGKNHISCIFSDTKVRIEIRLNNEIKIMAEADNDFEMPKNNLSLGMFAEGDRIECLIGESVAARANYYNKELLAGGIGLKIWDPEPSNSKISIKEVAVYKADDRNETVKYLPKYAIKIKEIKKVGPTIKEPPLVNNITSSVDAHSPQIISPVASSTADDGIKSDEFEIEPEINDKNIPYGLDRFSSVGDWKNIFGKLGADGNNLMIGAGASTTASLAVLEGGDKWADYSFKATVDWLRGSGLSLVARYKDPKNYVACSYSIYGSYARIHQVENGVTKTFGSTAKLQIPYINPWEDIRFGIRVKEDNVECLINDAWVIRAQNIVTMPKTGKIGFKTWDSAAGVANVAVKKITVDF